MTDWTEGFGKFIETLKREKEDKMVHDLAKSKLKQLFRLFNPNSLIGVNVIEDDVGEYGVFIISKSNLHGKSEEDFIFQHMNMYDPDWVLWKDGDDRWGATQHIGDNDPANDVEKEYVFDTHNFNKVLPQIFGIFKQEFFDTLSEEENEYMKYD